MKKLLLSLAIIIPLLISCEIPFNTLFPDYAYEEYDGDLDLEKITSDASWSNRLDQASIVFDGYIWVIGGYYSGTRGSKDSYYEDIWKSSDGKTWELVTDHTPFKGVRGHALAVYDGAMYLSGGFKVDENTGKRGYSNEVWKSSDGEDWTLVSEGPWTARMNHGMVATDDALYIFGGFYNAKHYLDDMWKSTDNGTTWTELSTKLPGKRGAFGYCLVDDKIYIQGGAFEGANQSSSGQSDELVEDWGNLWMFDTNEENKGWIPLAEPTDDKTTNRSEHSLAYFDDKIWLLSGRSNSGQEFTKNQATYSTLSYDISNDEWSTDSNGAPADPRYSYSTAILNDQLYILGGYSTYGTLNDVWCTKEDN